MLETWIGLWDGLLMNSVRCLLEKQKRLIEIDILINRILVDSLLDVSFQATDRTPEHEENSISGMVSCDFGPDRCRYSLLLSSRVSG
jgi:hypothetical protein